MKTKEEARKKAHKVEILEDSDSIIEWDFGDVEQVTPIEGV